MGRYRTGLVGFDTCCTQLTSSAMCCDTVMCLATHKSAMSYMKLLSAARGWYLQVKNQQGQWINADPIPGTFVCNIGDMLKVPDKLHVNRADLL